MKIELAPGETLVVSLKESDGEFTIKFGEDAVTVEADMPDTQGRTGVIYEEVFRPPEDLSGFTDVRSPTWASKPGGFVLYPADKAKFLACLSRHAPLAVTAESIKDETTHIDLGYDSMDIQDVILDLEETFNISLPDGDPFDSVLELENKVAERLLNADR